MSDETKDSEKTGRIGMLCVTLAFLGLLLFLSKANACSLACNSCNSPSHSTTSEVCKDEFFEIESNSRYQVQHSCTPGARAEIVTSPPAPKPGILCHCINSGPDAGAAPAPSK